MVEPTLNGYRDLTMVAHGSSAFVYRAVQERLEREVAVKVLLVDDEMTTQSAVRKELDTTVSVSNHPHIVSIIDTGTTAEGQPYIVMEYCDGGSYTDILKKHGPLPVADVIDVGVKIGQALHAAHSANIIHRDVKPQNILRGQYGPALVDFGIARATADLASTGTLDKLTPLHASPEAIRREIQTAASDLFSLASTMWHLLAGHAPFANPEGGTDPTTHRQRLEHEPPPKIPREDIPPWLEELMGQALSKDARDRPQTAQEFSEALQQQYYGSTSAGIVRPSGAPMTMEDLASEQTIYRPSEGSTPQADAPMDPFGHHTSSGFTSGGAHIESGLGPSRQQMKQMLTGHNPNVGVDPASGAPVGEYPVSASPASAAPVSMAPPPTPWSPAAGDAAAMSAPPYSASPQQQYSAPPATPPVIERTPKQKNDDKGGLVPYIVMGSVVTLVLASVMVAWLWIINPGGDSTPAGPDDNETNSEPTEAETEGVEAPENVELADNGSTITITWDDPTDGTAGFVIVYTRADDDSQYDLLTEAEQGSTTATINALSEDFDYCFRVGVLVAYDSVPNSDPVCTERDE